MHVYTCLCIHAICSCLIHTTECIHIIICNAIHMVTGPAAEEAEVRPDQPGAPDLQKNSYF